MSNDLTEYYNKRAKEYERIYFKPERQEDIAAAGLILKDLFKEKKALEIACGTGFWTRFIAETAKSILATDINESVLEIARLKKIQHSDLNFKKADLYTFESEHKYSSLFAGFIWSHILKRDLSRFYKTIHALVQPGGLVVLMDNIYVEGSNHPIVFTDAEGNTFQNRLLDDGSLHQVLKNFATEEFLRKSLADQVSEFKFIPLKYFWILSYRTNSA